MGMKKTSLLIFLFAALISFTATGCTFAADNNTTDNITATNNTGLADSANPKSGTDINNSGQSDYVGPQKNTTKWTYNITTNGGSTTIGSDGTIYTGSTDGNLYALKPDGTLKWIYSIGSPIQSTPTIGNNETIYVFSKGYLYAINSNGTYLWKYYTGQSSYYNSPTIGANGTIYIGTNRYFCAVNPDGTQKWKISVNSMVYTPAAIGSNGTIYVTSGSYLYALNPDDGSTIWYYSASEGLNGPTISHDSIIYVTGDGTSGDAGHLYAFTSNGNLKWTYTASLDNDESFTMIYSPPVVSSNGTIYFGTETRTNAGDWTGSIYAINSNGTELWKCHVGQIEWGDAPSIGADGTIYIGSLDGNICALNSDGTLKWKYKTKGSIYSSPVIDSDGTLYLGSTDGVLYAIQDVKANFTTTTQNNNTIKFTDTSSNITTTWNWNFGDETTSDEQNPTHTYNTPGTYTITLIITTKYGDNSTTNKTLIVDTTAPTLNISLTGGPYNTTQTVTLTSDDNTAIICYTLDGSTPTTSSNQYTSPITIDKTATLKYAAVDTNGNWSPTYTQTYIIDTTAPTVTANLTTGTYNKTQSVKLTSNDNTATIYYTTNGTTPTTSSTKYTGPITINTTTTLKFAALDNAGNWSPVSTEVYTIDTTAPTVTANLTTGTYNNTQSVKLTSNDNTATIYYTLDNSTPNTNSNKYTGPININTTTTLRYAAVDPAGNWSPLYSETYSIPSDVYVNVTASKSNPEVGDVVTYNYTGPQTNTTKWTYGDLTVYGSTVIGSDGTIYVASYDGILYAFNSKGVLLWTWTTRSYILGSPTIGSDGTIYITNWMNSTTYAISSNGTLIWKYTTGDYCTCSPVISADGTIYIVTTNDTNSILYALNPTGTLKWTYTLGKTYGSSPLIGNDGTIYITDYDGIIYAVNTDGTLKWTYTLTGTYYSTLSIGPDGTLYIGTRDGIIYAINNNGTTKWTYRTYEFMHGAPAISSNGTIYAVGSTKLYAIDSNGNLLWTYTIGEVVGTGLTSAAIGSDGTIYIGSSTGLYALTDNGTNATLKWSYSTGSIAGSPAIASDGTLYIGTINGTFYAFNDRAVNFTIERVNGTALTVQFNGSSTVTPVTSWKWYFGDGEISTEQNPTHIYAQAGNYTIGLVAILSDGSMIVRPAIMYIEALDITAPTVNTTLPSGTYINTQNITLTANDDRNETTIYYTIDGSNPTTSSTRNIYTHPITIYDSTTIKFVSVDKAGNWSPISNETYIILHVVYVQDASSYNATTINQDIQNLLDTTPEGYVVVFKGTQYDNRQLVINKPLTLLSANGTRIVTSSSGSAVFLINGTQAAGTQIIGFTILTNTTTGILLNNTNNVTVYNVQVTSNGGTGILVNNSSNVVIAYVSVTNSSTGVQVTGSNNTEIISCTFTGNVNGINVENSTNTTIYSVNISNNVESGVQIINSSNSTVYGATIKSNGLNGSNTRSGVYLNSTTNTIISNCQIIENWYGIYTRNTYTTNITANYINNNELDGIILNGNIINTTISGNELDGNMNGIQINGAYDNLLIDTNLITNSNVSKHDDEISYNYRGQGIVFGGASNGASSIIINHNFIVGNGHRDIETRYGAAPSYSIDGDYNYIPGSNWLNNYCCMDKYDAQMEMRITRIGDGTFIVQFFDGTTGKLVSGFLPSAMTFDSGYKTIIVMYSGSEAATTFNPSDIKDGVTASFLGRSIKSSLYNTIKDYTKRTEQPAAGSMGSGLGSEFGSGTSGTGPGKGSGNLPGTATSSGTSGSSSNSGATSGTVALGAAASASASGSSSTQGSGLGEIGKKIQELIMNELKNHSQLWGIIAIVVLLVAVILAYYRKSIKSMLEKSKK